MTLVDLIQDLINALRSNCCASTCSITSTFSLFSFTCLNFRSAFCCLCFNFAMLIRSRFCWWCSTSNPFVVASLASIWDFHFVVPVLFSNPLDFVSHASTLDLIFLDASPHLQFALNLYILLALLENLVIGLLKESRFRNSKNLCSSWFTLMLIAKRGWKGVVTCFLFKWIFLRSSNLCTKMIFEWKSKPHL